MTIEPALDSRVAALAGLAEALMTQYAELAQNLADHLPGEVKAELVEHARNVLGEAQARFKEIASGEGDSSPGTYVLSTRRPGVVSTDS